MADELNGRDGGPAGTRSLRVTFAPGTAPTDATPTVVEVNADGRAAVDGTTTAGALTVLEPPRARLHLPGAGAEQGDHQVLVTAIPDAGRSAAGIRRLEVVLDGWRFELDVDSEARARLRERATSAKTDSGKGGPSEVRAIIPGRVVSVEVAEGDAVERGGRLLVLEAMKMQNEVRATRAGTVARLAVGAGQTVELGDLLLVIE